MSPVEIKRTFDPQTRGKIREKTVALYPGQWIFQPTSREFDPKTGHEYWISIRVACDLLDEKAIIQDIVEEGRSRINIGSIRLGFRRLDLQVTDWELQIGKSYTVHIGENEVMRIEMK